MMLISYLVLFVLLYISSRVVTSLKLEKYFISIPLVGSVSYVLLNWILHQWGLMLTLSPKWNQLFVVLFIFTIGMEVGRHSDSIYWRRFLIFFLIASLCIAFLHIGAVSLSGDLRYVVGPYLSAYNEELLNRMVVQSDRLFVQNWSMLQLVFIMMITPLFLMLVQKRLERQYGLVEYTERHEKLTLPMNRSLWISVGIAAVSYLIKVYLGTSIPFLFPFVISGIFGFGIGRLLIGKTGGKVNKFLDDQHQIGTISLYLFIMSSFYHACVNVSFQVAWSLLGVVLGKIIVVGMICSLLVRIWFRRLDHHERLVAIVAGWTFILNAPVVCMHGMRTVVNRFGPAPHVLLIVPPVVLWLINYVQLGLHLILQQ